MWCSSYCFSHFPLACRNLRIDITTLDFTPRPEIMDYMRAIVDDDNQYIEDVLEGAYEVIVEANSRMGYKCEPDKVQIPRYLNAYYYYRANGEDAIPYERYTARLNRVISALLVEGYKVEFDYYTTEEG